jgi:hypothetical protein
MKFMEAFYIAEKLKCGERTVKDAIHALGMAPAVTSMAMGVYHHGYTERQQRAIAKMIRSGKKTRVPREGPWLDSATVSNMYGYGTGSYVIKAAKKHGIKLAKFMIGPTASRYYWKEDQAKKLDKFLAHFKTGLKAGKQRGND